MAKKRINTDHEATSLTNNPFSALGDARDSLPESADKDSAPASQADEPYTIARSKKGNWKIAVEKRAGGKMVTILSGVSGDVELLLQKLKKHCATGGAAGEASIELQGDQASRIKAFLEK